MPSREDVGRAGRAAVRAGALRWAKLGVAIACFSVASARAAQPAQREDTQIWTDVQGTHPLGEATDLLLSGGFRLGRGVSHPVYERGSVGVAFKVGRYLTVTPFYSYYATQPLAGTDVRENRLSLDATPAATLGHWTLTDRNRIERRLVAPRDSTRYRNRVQFEHPVRLGTVTVQGFFSDEVFYDWSYRAWVRNRFSIGGGHPLTERLSLDVYFLRQDDGRARPGDLNAVGITLKARF